MNKEFEKLPEITERLSDHIVFIGNKYTTPNHGFYDLVNWLNGAWYAYQEQQQKKEKVLSKINQFESQSVDDKRLFLNNLLTEIKELLK